MRDWYGEELRKKHGMSAMAKLNVPKIMNLIKKNNIVADGLYSFQEYKLLKNKFPKELKVIAIYAPPETRYKRLSDRKVTKDDTKKRNRKYTRKDAIARDYAEIENLEKGGPIAMADYTVLNTKNLRYLNEQLDEIITKL